MNERRTIVRMSISICPTEKQGVDKRLKTLERVKESKPSYSAWKSDAYARFFNGFSDKPQPNAPIDFKRQFRAVGTPLRLVPRRSLGLHTFP